MKKIFLIMDVGGSFVKCNLLDGNKNILKYEEFDAKANGSKDAIIENFCDIIFRMTENFETTAMFSGICLAFPGPFDYENGISLLRNLNKYDSIFGVNLKKVFTDFVNTLEIEKSKALNIVFENDAGLFGLGQVTNGNITAGKRAICFTIGTGLGSAFLDDGMLIKTRADVPEAGWVYSYPFGNSIIDDYISKRGILTIASSKGLENVDVKDIADLANSGDKIALKIFTEFGYNLALAIKPFNDMFKPDFIVLGGQISKSVFLFSSELKKIFPYVQIKISEDTSYDVCLGGFRLIKI